MPKWFKTCPRCETPFIGNRNQVFCRTDECLEYKTTCTGCGETKPSDEFYMDKRRNLPFSKCKICTDVKNQKWLDENPEKRKEAVRKSGNKRGIERYGITQEQYDQMVEDQNGLCAICGNPETKVMRSVICRLAIDHEHDSGRVRQLLCSNCNAILGMAGDDIERLQQCIEYLCRHGGKLA